MSHAALRVLGKLARAGTLILLASLGSVLMTRLSPGYFTEAREMDAAYSAGARAEMSALKTSQQSIPKLLTHQVESWAHGDLGRSRHFDVPVAGLLKERLNVTARLLLLGMTEGWLLAGTFALLLSARRGRAGELPIAASTAFLLAVPAGVLATFSLLTNKGGPVLTLALLVAVREFKLLYGLLREAWNAPHLLYARAQGTKSVRIALFHLLPGLRQELVSLVVTSLVISLSAIVPVEVIFDLPGLGQLAWTAAMNRDLPVLSAVTAVLAAGIAFGSMWATPEQEVAACA